MSHSRSSRSWLGSLALVPGTVLSILPSVTCPFCISAYAAVVSALGLGFVLNQRVLVPLIVVFLAIGILTIAWSTRSHKHLGPLVASGIGSLAVVAGRVVWHVPVALYVGAGMLVVASLWNLWLKRPKQEPLVPIRLGRPQ